MRLCKYGILLLLLYATSLFSQERGTVGENITFKVHKKGTTYDLHSLLNSGKHVYVLSYKYPG